MARALEGRVAVITGASRGIGQAIAVRFPAEGARVVCAARTLHEGDHRLEGSLATTVEEIRAASGEATAVQANVASEQDCERLIDTAASSFRVCAASFTHRMDAVLRDEVKHARGRELGGSTPSRRAKSLQ